MILRQNVRSSSYKSLYIRRSYDAQDVYKSFESPYNATENMLVKQTKTEHKFTIGKIFKLQNLLSVYRQSSASSYKREPQCMYATQVPAKDKLDIKPINNFKGARVHLSRPRPIVRFQISIEEKERSSSFIDCQDGENISPKLSTTCSMQSVAILKRNPDCSNTFKFV